VQLSIGPDITQATNAVNNFVSAYNQVIGDINQEFTVNAGTNNEGPLGSDTALRSLQSSLLSDVTYAVSGDGGLVNLSSLGINMNDDGTLTAGASPTGQTLSQVLSSNPTAFVNFFQNASSTGFANNFNTDLTNLTDPTLGVLNVDLTQNKAQQQTLSDNISNFETQLTAEQQSLTTQFDQVNASLQAYPLLLQQVTETLGTLSTQAGSSDALSPTLTSGL
jgi:flagellar hook-associated protein 2